MKTTLEIPDDLFREAKSIAALEGCKLKDFVAEGLLLRMNQRPLKKQKFVKFPLIKSKRKLPLNIPDDIASTIQLADDSMRYEASL